MLGRMRRGALCTLTNTLNYNFLFVFMKVLLTTLLGFAHIFAEDLARCTARGTGPICKASRRSERARELVEVLKRKPTNPGRRRGGGGTITWMAHPALFNWQTV